MIKINNIHFSKKTIENFEVNGDDIKEVQLVFLEDTFRITIIKDNDELVVKEVFEQEENISTEVTEEETSEEVIEEPVVEDQVNNKLTIDDLKKIIYETIPKKNTAETYFRTIKQVHDNFDEDGMNQLLKKENEIIEFIETKYDKLTTIKNKLCGVLKVYNLLNLESNVLKSKIDHYMVSLSIREDKKKEDPTDKKNDSRS